MIEIYFDGGCKPNPGMMETCIVIRDGKRQTAYEIKHLGLGTNNDAEWAGLVWAVLWAKSKGVKACVIKGDSKMVVNQALGFWKINKELHVSLYKYFKQISQGIDFSIVHVRRESNLAGIYLEQGYINAS